MKKRKVGLALGGGAARGLAHVGVLEILEREQIPIDIIAGTSAGAAVGALFAQGKSTSDIKRLARDFNWKQRLQTMDPALPVSGLIAGRRIKRLLKSIIGDVQFSELKIPLACVATDIDSGQEVVISQGSVLEAVRASISIPIVFTVVNWQGRYLVDGGLVDPVPVGVLKDMGADFIIAVNVTPRLKQMQERVYLEASSAKGLPATRVPNLINIMLKAFSITNSQVIAASLNGADIIIEPCLSGIGLGDFTHTEQCILEGGLAAIDAIPEIKKLLAL